MGGRNGRPRPRSRPGGRGFLFLAVAGVMTVSLVFVLGVLVGREWARNHPPKAQTAEAKKPPAGPRRALSDVEGERAPQIQEKLTFYQTLTAPLAAPPPPPRLPAKERDDQVKDHAKGQPEPGGPQYTVQVGAYGSRPPAEEIERKLKGVGFEAYVVTVGGDEARMTYRVRVGSFGARAQAEQVAERLRSERGLTPFVTTK